MTLEANPDYWGGAPNIDTLILRPIPEISTRVAALGVGEVDMILAVPPDQVTQVEDAGATVISAGVPGVVYIQMFPESPKGGGEPLADVRVRRALNHAVDVDAIIETILNGHGKRAATVISSQAFGYDPDIQPYSYDPELARQLLAEAGYPDGFSIQFDLASLGLPNDTQVIEAVLADWAAVGVNAQVNQMDRAAIVPLKLEYQIAPLFYWTFRGFDADNPGYRQLRSGQQFFYYAGHTPEVDELLDAQHESIDPEERQALWSQILTKFHEDAPYVVLYEPEAIYGVGRRVHGFEPGAKDTVFLGDVSVTG
jgi:peptide/nickel transport system substrate-binding protein